MWSVCGGVGVLGGGGGIVVGTKWFDVLRRELCNTVLYMYMCTLGALHYLQYVMFSTFALL